MSYIGASPTSVAFLTDQFSGTGSQTAFTMSVAPANTASVLVNISGVTQDPTTYSVNGLTLTFSSAPPAGTANISVRYLGIPASGVTTTAYRTLTEFTATAGQTTFTPPSYTAGYITVLRNGVQLGTADFTASNGTTVVLANAASSGDLITTESFYVSSVLNAIPAVANAVTDTYLNNGAVTQTKVATGVAGTGPAFSAIATVDQTLTTATTTKLDFAGEIFDTNNNFASSRFTPTVAGYYQINSIVRISVTNGTNISCYFYKNGSVYSQFIQLIQTAYSGSFNQFGSDLIYFNGTTDYVEVYVNITGTSPIMNWTSDNQTSTFSGFLARAA